VGLSGFFFFFVLSFPPLSLFVSGSLLLLVKLSVNFFCMDCSLCLCFMEGSNLVMSVFLFYFLLRIGLPFCVEVMGVLVAVVVWCLRDFMADWAGCQEGGGVVIVWWSWMGCTFSKGLRERLWCHLCKTCVFFYYVSGCVFVWCVCERPSWGSLMLLSSQFGSSGRWGSGK